MWNRNIVAQFLMVIFFTLFSEAQVIRSVQMGPASSPTVSLRYVNPLSISDSDSIGDPFVLRFHDTYYLYLSGGMVWSSDDLVHWKHHPSSPPSGISVEAPAAFEYQGFVYLTGNNIGLLRSRSPLGSWEYLGDFKDANGETKKCFDPMVFEDEDGKVYLYYSGRSTHGIYGVQLNRTALTSFVSAPTHLFAYNKSHLWERAGARNNYSNVSWIEAPWMTKRKGTYYLQYSASGTDWTTYAVGLYTGKSPLGPFTYDSRSPILVDHKGLINGTGHHCIIQAPDGSVWALYTILYRNWNRHAGMDRRVGMDPVGFDPTGKMFINGPSETPQWGPGVRAQVWLNNDTSSIPLSIDASYTVSSEAPGSSAPNAFDNNVRTYWQPAETDSRPSLTLDLGAATPEDAAQLYMVNSARLLFSVADIDRQASFEPLMYRYTIEISSDGKTFHSLIDKTGNDVFSTVDFDETHPTKGRFIRLTFHSWPKGSPLRLLEFTVFGQPINDGD